MPVWRNARLRRLYGNPEDPIEAPPVGVAGSRTRNGSKGEANTGGRSIEQAASQSPTPPPPKRIKREKTRPESEYELVHNVPATCTAPDYSLLTNPISEEQAKVVAYAVHTSRQNWLSGSMFETFWTRKPRGKKIADGQVNLREKMTKLHECSMTLGPHTFPVRLFTVRDDSAHLDDEADKRIEDQLAKQKMEKMEVETKLEESETRPKAETTSNGAMSEKSVSIENVTDAPSTPPLGSMDKDPSADTTIGCTVSADEKSREETADAAESPQRPGGTKISNELVQTELPENTDPSPSAEELEKKQKSMKKNAKAKGIKSKKITDHTASNKDESSDADDNKSANIPEDRGPKVDIHNDRALDSTQNSTISESQSFHNERESLQAEKLRNVELEKQLSHNGTPIEDTELEHTQASKEPLAPIKVDSASSASSSRDTQGSGDDGESQNIQAVQPPSQPVVEQPQFIPQPQPNPSQLVIYRLQQMAARDPSLSELMKHVASGTAPPDSIAKFQEVINRVKASIFAPPPPQHVQRKAPKNKQQGYLPPKQPMQRGPPIYHTRANAKAVMLAIEFEESPTDRYLLPKRSIIEYIPEKEEMLWSFLHVHAQSKNDKKKYTPVTAVFHGIPFRIAQTLERCVRKPEVVAVYMKEEMSQAERADPWHIWFQIEKNDEVLLDLIKKTAPPYMPPPAPPKKPTKPRKPRGPTQAQLDLQRSHERIEQFRLLQRGQPLFVRPYFQTVVGQPLIQVPSTWQPFMMRPPLPYQFQALPPTLQYGQPMPLRVPVYRPQFPDTTPAGVTQPNIASPTPNVQQPVVHNELRETPKGESSS